MRILHVITDLKIGGESKQLVRVISSLRSLEHSVCCLTVTTDPIAAPTDVQDELEELGVRVVDLGVSPRRPLSVVRAFARLCRLARQEKPDLIHSTLIHANLLAQPLAWLGFPVICSHVVTDPWRRNWQRIIERYSGTKAVFLANSHAVAESLIAGGLDRRRIRVLYYGVDTDHFRPEGPSADGVSGDKALLGIGRLEGQKGFDDLIRAAAQLATRPDVVIIGDGPLREHLTDHASKIGVRLMILPAVRDVAPYLRSAVVVALPSLYEGLPNVLLEALATGCAVVASDLPGHREVIRNGTNGLLVPPSDVDALRQAIQSALEDDGSLGAAARQTMLAQFRGDTWLERRRLLYESIAGRTT
jgi:glycosyltransferase involved in cell wall biosynthesis